MTNGSKDEEFTYHASITIRARAADGAAVKQALDTHFELSAEELLQREGHEILLRAHGVDVVSFNSEGGLIDPKNRRRDAVRATQARKRETD